MGLLEKILFLLFFFYYFVALAAIYVGNTLRPKVFELQTAFSVYLFLSVFLLLLLANVFKVSGGPRSRRCVTASISTIEYNAMRLTIRKSILLVGFPIWTNSSLCSCKKKSLPFSTKFHCISWCFLISEIVICLFETLKSEFPNLDKNYSDLRYSLTRKVLLIRNIFFFCL